MGPQDDQELSAAAAVLPALDPVATLVATVAVADPAPPAGPLGLPQGRLVLGLLLASRVVEGYASSRRTPPAHGPRAYACC